MIGKIDKVDSTQFARWIGGGLLTVAVLVFVTVLANAVIVRNMAWNDTIPRDVGCDAFLAGHSPYGADVTAAIQARLPYATQDEQRFAYPAHLCLVLLPVWLLPYAIAAPLWIGLIALGLFALPLVYGRLALHWTPAPLTLLLLVTASVLGWRYSMMTLVLGQYTALILAGLVGSGIALAHRRQLWAGLLLIAITIRPEGAILAGGLLALALVQHQWRAILVFAAGVIVLWLGTRAFIGPWEADFLAGIGAYAGYNTNAHWLPMLLGPLGAGILSGLAIAWAGWLILRLRHEAPPAQIIWGSAGLAALVLLLVPQTNPYTLIYLLPGIVAVLAAWRGNRLIWAVILALMGAPWLFFLGGRGWANVDQLVYPILMLISISLSLAYGAGLTLMQALEPEEAIP